MVVVVVHIMIFYMLFWISTAVVFLTYYTLPTAYSFHITIHHCWIKSLIIIITSYIYTIYSTTRINVFDNPLPFSALQFEDWHLMFLVVEIVRIILLFYTVNKPIILSPCLFVCGCVLVCFVIGFALLTPLSYCNTCWWHMALWWWWWLLRVSFCSFLCIQIRSVLFRYIAFF